MKIIKDYLKTRNAIVREINQPEYSRQAIKFKANNKTMLISLMNDKYSLSIMEYGVEDKFNIWVDIVNDVTNEQNIVVLIQALINVK